MTTIPIAAPKDNIAAPTRIGRSPGWKDIMGSIVAIQKRTLSSEYRPSTTMAAARTFTPNRRCIIVRTRITAGATATYTTDIAGEKMESGSGVSANLLLHQPNDWPSQYLPTPQLA